MIFDANLKLADDQAVTATAVSENVISWPDLNTVYGETAATARDLGKGVPIPLLIQVTEDFATLTSLTITVETSANADLSSSTVLASSPAIPAASLVAGYRPSLPPVMPEDASGKYFGLRFTVGGSNATAGQITAGIVAAVQTAG